MLYFWTIFAVATRNVKKLFNSDAQASINYLTVLSEFCANYYVSTKNDIMNKTHNVNVFYNNIYVSLRLHVQNQRKKWNFLLNFHTMRKLSDLYSRIFQNY